MDTTPRRLVRSRTNRMIGGVCAGIGDYANIDPTVVRLLTALLFFLTGPGIIVAYLVLALIIPEDAGQPAA
ncbi:MAG TPA: PspC domain-containing protein [Anaerolineales bacterium]|nr:PspC domain-containing protein [Anaerolineales bacterium]